MHEYDVALKLVLQDVDVTLRALTGGTIRKWINIELPEITNPRVDLLGETPAGGLVQIEFQSENDAAMPLRMADYYLRIGRRLGKFPEQVVLYVGNAALTMTDRFESAALRFAYRLIDVRDLDGEALLESERVGDNIVAVLTRLPDVRGAVQRILSRIASLSPERRETALSRLVVLSGLRKTLGGVIEEETRKMPILNDILDHPLLGREYKRGLEEGRQQGVQQGLEQGELTVLRRLMEKRFGTLPAWAEQRLRQLSAPEMESLALKLLDSNSLTDLFA